MTALSSSSLPLAARIAAALRAAGEIALLWVSAEPRIAAIERLSRLTDEQLAARGTTRAAELQRILGPHAIY